MITVLKNEYSDWKSNKVTKALAERMFMRREEMKEAWVLGQVKEESPDYVRGYSVALKNVLDYIISDFETIEENEDDQTSRV